MPKPKRCRRICKEPFYRDFNLANCDRGIIKLTYDEYEVIRLLDKENLSHEECAELMDISRVTVTEIYKSARNKIADMIVNGKGLKIVGGKYRVCDGSLIHICKQNCKISRKEVVKMKVAITSLNGEVFGHFGKCTEFRVFEVSEGKCVEVDPIVANGDGHGALVNLLLDNDIKALICGGIGNGARSLLTENSILLYPGVSGKIQDVIRDFVNQTLVINENCVCNHHGENHKCGDGHGEHKCNHEEKENKSCSNHKCH